MTAQPYIEIAGMSDVTGPQDGEHLNVSGDLPSVLDAGPMFRQALLGYDRFQVDTYVRWAEEELAIAEREREHLTARHLSTRSELDEARELLAHSSAGAEFLRTSGRTGALLAAAADEAEAMRAEGEAARAAGAAEAERIVADADRALADAEHRAGELVAAAIATADETVAAAQRVLAEAERTRADTGAEAEARLAEVRAVEQRAAEQAQRLREAVAQEAAAARLQARDELVAMLATGREGRRRADDEAAAARARLDREAAERRASLLAEIAGLERRRASLLAEVELAEQRRTREPAAPAAGSRRPLGWVRQLAPRPARP